MAVSLNINSITRFVPTDASRCRSAARCRRPLPRRAMGRPATSGAMSPRTTAAVAMVVVWRWMMRCQLRLLREVAMAAAAASR